MRATVAAKTIIGFALMLAILVAITIYILHISKTTLEDSVKKQSEYMADELLKDLKNDIFAVIEDLNTETMQRYVQTAFSPQAGESVASGINPAVDIVNESENRQIILPHLTKNELVALRKKNLSRRLERRFISFYENAYGYKMFDHLLVIDKDGRPIAIVGDTDYLHDNQPFWWRRARERGFFVGDVRFDQDTNAGLMPIVTRINDRNGNLLGYIHISAFASQFFRSLDIGQLKYKTTILHLFSGDGKRLFSTRSYRFMEDLSDTDFFKAMTGDLGSFLASNGGKKSLIAYSRAKNYRGFEHFHWILAVETDQAEALAQIYKLGLRIVSVFAIVIAIVILAGLYIGRTITRPLLTLQQGVNILGSGNLEHRIDLISNDEIGDLCSAFNKMSENLMQADSRLRENQRQIEEENWVKTGQSGLNDHMRGEQSPEALCQKITNFLAEYLNAQTGAIYLIDEVKILRMTAGYAFSDGDDVDRLLKPGEGFVGQCALEGRTFILSDIQEELLSINLCAVKLAPRNFIAVPFLFEGTVKGVIFLGALDRFTEAKRQFLNRVSESIAIAVNSAQSRLKLKELLEETQRQSEELQSQQEELRVSNEELEEQTMALKESESKLQAQQEELTQTNQQLEIQQEELRETNDELKKKTEALERNQAEVVKRNAELNSARLELEKKARDLEISGKYKSEFLANMSHELRTPLNSLLIFSQLLFENKEGNLNDKQVKFARDIHASGAELLSLIDDILDLSKIEAGKIELFLENISITEISAYILNVFQPMADKKQLALNVEIREGAPKIIRTDRQKLYQILKNLLSNAFKFTETGGIETLIFSPKTAPDRFADLNPDQVFAISVTDTGIGIPQDKQKLIFEAFQQVDGTTSRRFGGTGLGLSISRELAQLLGCEIQLESKEGEGSAFTLYHPVNIGDVGFESTAESVLPNLEPAPEKLTDKENQPDETQISEPKIENVNFEIKDNGDVLEPGVKSILIVDDDPKFAQILMDLGHKKGFKCLVAQDGETGLTLAEKRLPSAIILDINLPKLDGWTVMERFKCNPKTRAIPVHFISVLNKKMVGLKMGAIGFLTKPVTLEKLNLAFEKIDHTIRKTSKRLLIVEDDEEARKSLAALFEDIENIQINFAENAQKALETMNKHAIDVIILDLRLPDMTGFDLLSKIELETSGAIPPVVVYTGKEISAEEEARLRKHAESIILKGVNSSERLLDEVSLFIHRVESDLPAELQDTFRMVHDRENILNGKNILLVDDDMRNVYALMNILEEKGIHVRAAANGKEALECLEADSDINLVLMDVMMPVMDGYEAIEKIREREKWAKLPVIALTAKAMKGDRDKCIKAGANDYLAKPIDTEKLISLLRVWMYD